MSGVHARLSPSGAERWVNCPGAPNAEEGYEDRTSYYAAEGTVAHRVASECRERGLTPADFKGQVLHADGYDVEVDQDMVHHVGTFLEQVNEENENSQTLLVEVAVPIGHITGEEGATGTADIIGIEVRPDNLVTLRAHDLKYGQGVRVEAEGSLQLAMYMLGALEHVKWLLDLEGLRVDEVIGYIHQPRLDHFPVWHTNVEELLTIAARLTDAAIATLDPDAPRIPGESQCRFCKHRAACPELAQFVQGVAANDPPAEPEAIGRIYPSLKMIRDWCATVEARAIELLEGGTSVPGVKLVEGRGSRVWNAPEEKVRGALTRAGDLRKKDVVVEKLVSVAQAEKLVPKDKWAKLSAKYVERRPGKPTVALDSDKRPELNVADALGFADLTEES